MLNTPVRCADGHLFSTIWIPAASFKAVRLGDVRRQRCPVGHHWSEVTRLDPDDPAVTPDMLAAAARKHDAWIP